MNSWHDLPAGPKVPEIVYALVEIPKGSRNKYEFSKELGVIKVDRVLYSSLYYPGDYGFIPRTFCDDGDPLDILVMLNEPTFSGCLIEARPLGVFRMMDRDVPDAKILAVPARDPIFADYHDIGDIPQHFLREVEHFFAVYKDLEGVRVKPIGWQDAAVAKAEIERAVQLYRERY
jgi:inorganic pyrophosphatase